MSQSIATQPVAPTAADNVKASSPARFPPNVAKGRLNLNEPAFAPSPKVIEAIRANAQAVGRYPDAQCADLGQALAKKLSVQPDQLVFGNGSDELLSLVGHAFLQQDSSMVYPAPSFPRYRMMAEFAGAQSLAVPVRTNGSCDVDAMLGAHKSSTRVVVVTTPNNPTGAMLSAQELTQFATQTPTDTLLVVDEAYFEFAQHAGGADALQVMRKRVGPWIVLRTLTLWYRLPH